MPPAVLPLIPGFIQTNDRRGLHQGILPAAVVFLDISGFTRMTERLMQGGKAGAELMSGLLNRLYVAMIDAITDQGGFVASIAGDALTVIFPEEAAARRVLCCAAAVRSIVQREGILQVESERFILSVKIGLARGPVEWGIIDHVPHKAFFFRGEAIRRSIAAEQRCGGMEIIVHDSLVMPADSAGIDFTVLDDHLVRLDRIDLSPLEPINDEMEEIVADYVRVFHPTIPANLVPGGEFRQVVTIFMAFAENLEPAGLSRFVGATIERVDTLGGYFNGLDFGDKGGTMLVFFGAPTSHEDDLARAITFVTTMQHEFQLGFAVGLSRGVAYAGVIGGIQRCVYTCIGDTVNLAARLMEKAAPGQILLSAEAARAIRHHQVRHLGEVSFKGISEPIDVFELGRQGLVEHFPRFEHRLIGRNAELDQLLLRCQPLEKGKFGGVVFLWGEAGIGKSRLVRELANRLGAAVESCFLQADGIVKGSLNPFVSFFTGFFEMGEKRSADERRTLFETHFESLLNRLKACPDRQRAELIQHELIRTKSFLAALVGIHWVGSDFELSDARGRFENTVDGIKSFFTGLSLVHPVLLILEDIHWLDSDSRLVVQRLTRAMEDFPLVIVATGRFADDGSKPAPGLDADISRYDLVLKRLPPESNRYLIANLLKDTPDDSLQSFVQAKSEGNPFFIEQFLLYLEENGLLVYDQTGVHLRSHPDDLPVTITAIIVARIDRLTAELRDLVQVASILGREFELPLLEEVIRLFKSGLDSTVERPASETLVGLMTEGRNQQIWTDLSELRYIFTHALLRDAAYEMQLRARIRKLHHLAADSLERRFIDVPERLPEIAFHYDRAENPTKAVEFLGKAAEYCSGTFKNDQSLELYQRLLHYRGTEEQQLAIREKMVAIYNLIGQWDHEERLYREMIELSRKIGLETQTTRAMLGLGNLELNKGRIAESLALIDAAEEIARKNDDRSLMAQAVFNRGIVFMRQGNQVQARIHILQRLHQAEESNDRLAVLHTLNDLGNVATNLGNYSEAIELFDRAIMMAKELGNLRSLAKVTGNRANLEIHQGRYDQALTSYEQSLAIARKIGDKQCLTYTLGHIATVYRHHGQWSRQLDTCRQQLAFAREMGDIANVVLAYQGLAIAYWNLGQTSLALEFFQKMLAAAEKAELGLSVCFALGNIGTILMQLWDFHAAIEYLKRQLTLAEELKSTTQIANCLGNMTNILIVQGDFHKARELNDRQRTLLESLKDPYQLSYALGYQGTIARKLNNLPAAAAAYEKAIAIDRELGLGAELIDDLTSLAALCVQRGAYEEAWKYAEEALTSIREQGSIMNTAGTITIAAQLDWLLRQDREGGIRRLRELLQTIEQARSPENIVLNAVTGAESHTELFRLSGDESHRLAAESLYQQALQLTGNVVFSTRIADLKTIQPYPEPI